MQRFEINFNRNPNMRASDADRESTGDRLRQHHADGRLDAEEFQERIERCYAAKTIGELDDLIADLPREDDRRERGYYWPGRRMHMRAMIPFVPILIALIVVSALTGWHAVWLVFPLFFLSRMWLFRRSRWGMRWWDGYHDERRV
jgi:hypothetical protein